MRVGARRDPNPVLTDAGVAALPLAQVEHHAVGCLADLLGEVAVVTGDGLQQGPQSAEGFEGDRQSVKCQGSLLSRGDCAPLTALGGAQSPRDRSA